VSGSDDGERTLAPTPKRREDFRKQGRIAKARDAAPLAATFAALGVLIGSRQAAGHAISVLFARTHGDVGALARGEMAPLRDAGFAFMGLAVPVAIAAAIGGVVGSVAQVGFHFEPEHLTPKFEKMDPVGRLKELFSFKRGGVELVVSFLRIGAVGYVAYRTLLLDLPRLYGLSELSTESAIATLVDVGMHVVLWILGALALVAAVDYAQSKFRLEQDLKMTLKELKEETRAEEGDPKVKGRQRARARAMARKRALQSVKDATVVVTNPTHVSVALRYGAKDGAPVVIAKGHDELALAIRSQARRHGVPIVESRVLARALDAEVKVGHPIPEAHYAAVAKILAFVFKIRPQRPQSTAGAARR
jgi:flagellar biosynthesis protein FlhB